MIQSPLRIVNAETPDAPPIVNQEDPEEVFMHPALTMNNMFTNRRQRREAIHEYNRIVPHLPDYFTLFVNDLFDPALDIVSYEDLYRYHLNNYAQSVAWINANIKPKLWTVDPKYFALELNPDHGDATFYKSIFFPRRHEI